MISIGTRSELEKPLAGLTARIAQEIEDRCCVGALTARAVAEDIAAMLIGELDSSSVDLFTDVFDVIKDA